MNTSRKSARSKSRRLKRHRFPAFKFLFPLTAATLLSASAAWAQGVFTWDGGGADGNWQASPANWSTDVAPTPTSSLVFAGTTNLTTNNDYAANTQFNGITFDATAGAFILNGNTINLGGNVTNFSTTAQTISLGFNLLQNTTFNASAGSITDSGVISGGFGLTKAGASTLTLSGTNTYTGATTINEGTLALQFNAANSATGVVASTSALVMGGATSGGFATSAQGGSALTVTGYSAAATTTSTQSFAGTTFQNGRSTLTVSSPTNKDITTLALGAITATPGGQAVFAPGTNGLITTTTANTNGILGGWALVGTNFATVNASNQIVAYSAYTDLAGTTPTIANNAASNIRLVAANNTTLTGASVAVGSNVISGINTTGLVVGDSVSGSVTATVGTGTIVIPAGATIASIDSASQITLNLPLYLLTGTNTSQSATGASIFSARPTTLAAAGTTDVNAIAMPDENNRIIDIGSGNTLRLGVYGGILRSGTSSLRGSLTINNGTLTAGGAANTAGQIAITSNGPTGALPTVVINSNITNNGTGVVTLSKSGTSTLQITGTNTYSGGTYVNQGRLQFVGPSSLGTGNVYVNDDLTAPGQAVVTGSGNYANNFFISGTGPSTDANINTTSSGTTFTGGSLVVTNAANVTGTVTLLGAARISAAAGFGTAAGTISGQITGPGSLQFGASSAGNSGTLTLANISTTNPNNFAGGTTISSSGNSGAQSTTLTLGASEQIPNGAGAGDLTISSNANSTAQFNLAGFTETVNGLNSAGSGTTQRSITSTAAASLRIGDNNANGSWGGLISGAVAITKIGTGTQTFSSVNNYTGGTTISGGKLLLTNTIPSGTTTSASSGTGTAAVALSGGTTTTLSGTGNVNGLLTVTSGSRIAPGVNTTGTNTNFGVAGTLLLGTNNQTGGTIPANGLTLTSANLDFDLASAATGTSDLITTRGALTLGTVNFTFNELTPGTLDTANSYTLISGATSEIGALTGISGTVIQGDYTPSFSFSGNNLVVSFSTLTPVPEPSTWVMASLLGSFVVVRFLRRRSRAVV